MYCSLEEQTGAGGRRGEGGERKRRSNFHGDDSRLSLPELYLLISAYLPYIGS